MGNLKERLEEKIGPIELDLHHLNKYFDDHGFVGDERTRMGLSIGVLRRKCIGIVSSSGSGKTAVVDALLGLFDDNRVYKMESGSEKAQAYRSDNINNADIIYLTELQKAGDSELSIEILKNLGEGKEFKREVTRRDREGTDTQIIKAGKAIIYTKAIENKYESDAELDRRFPKLPTDITKHQNERVIKSKANKRSNPFAEKYLSSTETRMLKAHMNEVIKDNAHKYTFINPMADKLAEIIPSTFAISRTYTDHYFDFIEGVTLFNKKNRIKTIITNEEKKHETIFVAPEDCWQLHQIYGQQFLQDVLNIPPNGIKIIDIFHVAKEKGVGLERGSLFTEAQNDKIKLTIHEVFNLLKESGIVLKEQVIKKMLNDLMSGGYIHSDQNFSNGKTITQYYLNDEIEEFHKNINWNNIINEAKNFMEKNYPEYAEEYIKRFCDNPKAINPFSGEIIDLEQQKEIKKENIIENNETILITDDRDDWNE